MMLNDEDLGAILLTLKLASLVTAILLLVGTPIAWWLAHSGSRWKGIIGALVALPLVLPPAVLGFYLLVLMGPHGAVGQITKALGLGTLPFTFGGLVVASVIYSLPFVVQPLQNAFEAIGTRPLEVAATLRASPLDTFFTRGYAAGSPRIPDRFDSGVCAYHRRIRRGADGRRQHPRQDAGDFHADFQPR